ncbi:MAG: beta-N-acetylhexosaminidase, partial [Rhodospirillales bacterium]|nr:beta-N-acetylhexosaminidase [Rhodospirillales bacterium]
RGSFMKLSQRFQIALVLVLTVTGLASTVFAEQDSEHIPSLIPSPAEMQVDRGTFTVAASTRILVDDIGKETGRYLADLLRPATGYRLTILRHEAQQAPPNAIVLRIDADREALGAEGYELTVTEKGVVILAAEPAGLFYGVQTLRQLLPAEIESEKREQVKWTVPCVRIKDKPTYRWRGLMLDPARQFLTVDFIKRYVDIMALHKMNYLHLHLSDNQAFTVQIKRYPQLTNMKLWHPDARDPKWEAGIYSQDDIRELVAYAAARHITIVPEIEMPAHFSVIGATLPDVMCPNNPRRKDKEQWEPLQSHHWVSPCAGGEKSYEILQNILDEVMELFPSPYIHLGADEWFCKAWAECEGYPLVAIDGAAHCAPMDNPEAYHRAVDDFLK